MSGLSQFVCNFQNKKNGAFTKILNWRIRQILQTVLNHFYASILYFNCSLIISNVQLSIKK